MKIMYCYCRTLRSYITFACLAALSAVSVAQSTTAPSPETIVKTAMDDVREASKQLATALPAHTFGDPAKVHAAAGQAIPLLKRIEKDFDTIIAVKASAKRQFAGGQRQAMAMLAVLGDQPSIDELHALASDTNRQSSLRGKSGELLARWYAAEGNAVVQSSVVDDLEKLDHDNAKDNGLTLLTIDMSRSAASPQLHDRLQTLASDGMSSSVSLSLKQQLAAAAARKAQVDAAMSKLLDKPMVVVGTQPDGSPFSTAAWKGKVVLVDFWATWCGPCKAELPRLKEIYSKFHPKGLELLGVSNDYDASALKKYVAAENMPWPEMFDASAAADQQWNPVTLDFGISSIPMMFIIDKKGIARSVTARQDMEAVIPKLLAEAD